MKQRIVIKVHVESDKRRRTALKIAAATPGLHSLSLEGESSDQVVVTGNDVDAVCLTNQLRKKFHATLLSVEDMEEGGDEGDQDGGEEEDEEEEEEEKVTTSPHYDNYHPSCPVCVTYVSPCPICATVTYLPLSEPMYPPEVYNSYPNSCTIL